MEFSCDIIKKLAVLSENENGVKKEVNIISWNNRDPKIDIRSWKDGKSYRGLTFEDKEAKILYEALGEYFKEKE